MHANKEIKIIIIFDLNKNKIKISKLIKKVSNQIFTLLKILMYKFLCSANKHPAGKHKDVNHQRDSIPKYKQKII